MKKRLDTEKRVASVVGFGTFLMNISGRDLEIATSKR